MQRTQIYLDETQISRLDAMAAQRGATRSDLIRDAVDAFLARKARRSPEEFRAVIARVSGSWANNEEGIRAIAEARAELDARVQRLIDRKPVRKKRGK